MLSTPECKDGRAYMVREVINDVIKDSRKSYKRICVYGVYFEKKESLFREKTSITPIRINSYLPGALSSSFC